MNRLEYCGGGGNSGIKHPKNDKNLTKISSLEAYHGLKTYCTAMEGQVKLNFPSGSNQEQQRLNFHQYLVTARTEIDPKLLILTVFPISITSLTSGYIKIYIAFASFWKKHA